MKTRFYIPLNNRGFSLIELLLAVLIMTIALIPVLESFSTSFQSTFAREEMALLVSHARAKLEDVLAMDFTQVPVGNPQPQLSDTVTVLGRTVNRDVYVNLYDGNGDAVPDADLKKITVIIDDIQVETLKSNV